MSDSQVELPPTFNEEGEAPSASSSRYGNLSLVDYVNQQAQKLSKEKKVDFQIKFDANIGTPFCVKLNFKTESLLAKGGPATLRRQQVAIHTRAPSSAPHRTSGHRRFSSALPARPSSVSPNRPSRSNSVTGGLKSARFAPEGKETYSSDSNLLRKSMEGKPPLQSTGSLGTRFFSRLSNAKPPKNSPSSSRREARGITFAQVRNRKSRESIGSNTTGRSSVSVDPMKTAAINGVLKIYHDRNARNHVLLQKCCINVLKGEDSLMSVGDYNDDEREPIVDVCVIDAERDKCPKGWHCISQTPTKQNAYILQDTGRRYYLCYRRRTSTTETPNETPTETPTEEPIALSLNNDQPITDIQIKDMHPKSKLTPPGYEVITTNYKGMGLRINGHCRSGNLESGSVVISISRKGVGFVKDIAIVHPSIESTPAGFIELKYCPRGNPTNLNRNVADATKTHLCFSKDCSVYLMRNHDLLMRPDLKYLSPMLIACHLQEPTIAVLAIKLLEPLLLSGFLQTPDSEYVEKSCLRTLIRALCDSTCNWAPAYSKRLLKVLEKTVKLHYRFVDADNFIDLFLACMQIFASNDRRRFQKNLITICLSHHRDRSKKKRSVRPRENGVVTFSDLGRAEGETKSNSEGSESGYESNETENLSQNGVEEGKHDDDDPNTFIRGMLVKIGESVDTAKKSQRLGSLFRTSTIFSPEFRDSVNKILDLLFKGRESHHKKTAVLVLMLCKLSLGPLPEENYKSYASDSLDMLHYFVKKLSSGEHKRLRQHQNMMFVLRRFISTVMAIVFTSYTNSSRTSQRSFENALSLFKALWQKFPEQFKVELGTILHQVLLPLLSDELTPLDCKMRILGIISDFLSPQSLVDLYYNYDNRQTWLVYERMVDVLCELLIQSTPPIRIQESEERTIGDKPQGSQFHIKCLETLQEVIKCLRTWHKTFLDKFPRGAPTSVVEKHWDQPQHTRKSRARVGTVARRFGDQRARKRRVKEAIAAANKGGGKALKKAIKALIEDDMLSRNPDEIVRFVNNHIGELEIEEVGFYLGGTRPKEEEPFEEAIRICFMKQLHFDDPMRPLRLDRAMRILLTDSGFRLPADANPIHRILESFAQLYFQLTHEKFHDPDAVYLASYTILMLNTNLHNPSLKEKERMDLQKFFSLVGDVDGTPYGDREWTGVYNDISKEGYEIPMPVMPGQEPATTNGENSSKDLDREYDKLCKRLVRKALGELKDETAFFRKIYTSTSAETVYAMFTVSWEQCLGAVRTAIKAQDPTTVPRCLQCYSDILQLAIMLKQRKERETISKSLAEFTVQFDDFEEDQKQMKAKSAKSRKKRTLNKDQVITITDGLHLQQSWYSELESFEPKKIKQACGLVESVVKKARKHFTDSTNYRKLTAIQNKITNEINIVTNFRSYIGEGDIRKLCADGSHRAYRLFLFGDSIMYASGGPSKYKVHRVLQLAFSGIEDIGDAPDHVHAFKLVNPQKTVTFFTRNATDKKEWIRAITKAIKRCHKMHQHIVNAAEKLVKQGKEDTSFLDRFRKTSAFVGKTPEMLTLNKLQDYNDRCKLCFKVFSMFQGNKLCAYCLDSNICGGCCKNRVSMKDHSGRDKSVRMRYRVCEGCADMLCRVEDKNS